MSSLITENILQHLTSEWFVTALMLRKRPTWKDSFYLQITYLPNKFWQS